jgi:hypothetical protein
MDYRLLRIIAAMNWVSYELSLLYQLSAINCLALNGRVTLNAELWSNFQVNRFTHVRMPRILGIKT